MVGLKFKVVQLEAKDLVYLLALVSVKHQEDPEKWCETLEALEAGFNTDIRWADWDVDDKDMADASIPLIKWGGEAKWQMGLPVPFSLVKSLTLD